MTETLFVVIF